MSWASSSSLPGPLHTAVSSTPERVGLNLRTTQSPPDAVAMTPATRTLPAPSTASPYAASSSADWPNTVLARTWVSAGLYRRTIALVVPALVVLPQTKTLPAASSAIARQCSSPFSGPTYVVDPTSVVSVESYARMCQFGSPPPSRTYPATKITPAPSIATSCASSPFTTAGV